MDKINNCRKIPRITLQDEERFWSRVLILGHNQCWDWRAGKSNGYGAFSLVCDDGKRRNFGANRIALYLASGSIDPSPLLALHKCDNSACCNPNHLYAGVQKSSVQDEINRNRYRGNFALHPERAAGSNNPRAILTESNVATIRELWSQGVTQKELVKIFGVSKQSVSNIVLYKSWTKI